MSRFIDEHRERFGVEPICQTLGVSASAYYQRASGRGSRRRLEDQRLRRVIREVWEANYECYGQERIWQELRRRGEQAGRDAWWPRSRMMRSAAWRYSVNVERFTARSCSQ
ncbi:MAG: IS3 family transposase [Solirubrobacterales bacterium]|nr:IS3 family transposase [Solirubrobacterales bacterium]MBV9796485.1 IS3 family transposase [Solirubrobacterales bacterium]